jgi:DNA-binding MarR family transcriptional regulator
MGSHTSTTRAQDTAPSVETASIRNVMNSLRRIVRDLRLCAREAERSAGVSGAQLFVLQALADRSASSLNELADRTLTDQSSVSVIVRRLADRKLIARKPSTEDARRVELSLTSAGQRMLARCPEPTQARLVRALRRIDASELDTLTVGLRALVREMGIENAEPRMFFEETPGVSPTTARTSPRRSS